MAREGSSIIGSGTLPFTRFILPDAQRGVESTGEGRRMGTQVVITNPEDLLAADAFATSGITVGTAAAVEIVAPGLHQLPRTRKVFIQNITATNPVYIGPSPDSLTLVGWELSGTGPTNESARIILEILHNITIYAIATGGSADVRVLIY